MPRSPLSGALGTVRIAEVRAAVEGCGRARRPEALPAAAGGYRRGPLSSGAASTPQPARVVSRFIDDHVAGADKQGRVAARRDWNCNGDRQAVGNNFCGVWSTAQGAAL